MSGGEIVRLADVTTKVGSGSTPRGGETAYKPEGIPLIRSMNVHFNGFRRDGLAFLDEKQARALKNVEVRAGDVLLNITGASIGRVTVAPIALDGARVNQHVCIIRPDPRLDSSFLRWYLASPSQQRLINGIESGATRQALTKEKILGFEIPLPTLERQHEIVAEIEKQFSRIDEAVANLKRVKANLKRYKAAILKAAVEGRLVPTEAEIGQATGSTIETGFQLLNGMAEERRAHRAGRGKKGDAASANPASLYELPAGWAWASVEEVGRLQLGRQRAPQYHSGPDMRPYLRVQNVFEDRIDLSDVMEMHFSAEDFERFALKNGDILLNEGQSPELLGRPAMYRSELPGACFTNTLIRFQAYRCVLGAFALIVFRHYMHAGRFVDEGTITTNIAHLSLGRLASVEFPVPPMREQHRIVAEVDRRLSLVRGVEGEVEVNLKRAQSFRHAVLARQFSVDTGRTSGSKEC